MAEQSKTYCPLPFIHSHAGLNGKYKPCCNSDSLFNHWEFHTEKLSYDEWFRHPEMDQLRKDLLTGVQNKMCGVCWKQEQVGPNSYRTGYIRKYRDDNIDHQNPKITYIDMKLSNECNLACTHCDYSNSTQIHKDMLAMEQQEMPLPPQWVRSPGFERRLERGTTDEMLHTQPTKVVDELIELMPGLRHLKFTGGEPTITKEFFKLIDFAVEKSYAQNITLSITTNGTRFTPEFIQKMQKFKQLNLTVSCDGFGDTYEYIRYPFTWKMFEKRLKVIEKYIRDGNHNIRHISFNCVAQLQNIENIAKLEQWIYSVFGKYHYVSLYVQTHINPLVSNNHPSYLPKHILEKALSDITESNAKSKYNIKMYFDMLNYMIKNYDNEKTFAKYRDEENLQRVKQTICNIDKVRNQNYKVGLEPLTAEWLESLDAK